MKTQQHFVAFPLPESIRHIAAEVQQSLIKEIQEPIRWTNPEDFHITIVFLGEVTSQHVEKVDLLLHAFSSRVQACDMALDGLGLFPNEYAPSVLFLRAALLDKQFAIHVKRLKDQISLYGIPLDRRDWQPHITLGRIERQRPLRDMEHIPIPKVQWRASHITLMESNVKRTQPKYITLRTYTLL